MTMILRNSIYFRPFRNWAKEPFLIQLRNLIL